MLNLMKVLGLFLWILATKLNVDAKLACLSTEECEENLRIGSECVDGFCSNPFAEGCIKRMIESTDEEKMAAMNLPTEILDTIMRGRVCNTDDAKNNASDAPACIDNDFDYFEIRVHNANWESSIFVAWIMQIISMEILKVPVTVGLNSAVTEASSFYSPVNSVAYSSQAYPWEALRAVDEGCETTDEDCIDVMTEVWNGQLSKWTSLMQDGIIEPTDGGGQVGKLGWFIPGATAKRDRSLVSYYGLQGEENRAKLARSFKRPTSWVEYCENVSINNCTTPDDFASQYPESEAQAAQYFSEGLYTGYFRMLPENDCSQFPDTCTGYIVGPSCTWSTNIDAQLHWNNIVGLAPDGPSEPNKGYSYYNQIEIWKAANATKSDVMMWWWQPEPLVETFSFTDWNFQQIVLPTVTSVCSKSRITVEDRCIDDIEVRRGDPLGACDYEAHALQKIISSTLPKATRREPETSRSPGYPFIRSLKVTDLEIQSMLNDWIERNTDPYGNDAREAVCSWTFQNMDILLDFLPPGHPRNLEPTGSFDHGYVYFAMTASVLCLLGLLFVAGLVHHFRKRKVFVYAQEIFVKIILFGFLQVIIGGSIYTLKPTDATCIARSWLTNLGFSTVLSAVLVKMSTINRIMQKSKRLKRVTVAKKNMFGSLGCLVTIELVFLIVWTVVSPPRATEQLVLLEEFGNTVESSLSCRSDQILFQYILQVWHVLLLLVASVLAFQSRDIVPAFNESRSIGTMVYSNFLFMIIRLIVFVLGDRGLIQPSVFGASLSLLYVLDTLIATIIYVAPKCYEAYKHPQAYDARLSLRGSQNFSGIGPLSQSNHSKLGFSSNFEGASGKCTGLSSIGDNLDGPSLHSRSSFRDRSDRQDPSSEFFVPSKTSTVPQKVAKNDSDIGESSTVNVENNTNSSSELRNSKNEDDPSDSNSDAIAMKDPVIDEKEIVGDA